MGVGGQGTFLATTLPALPFPDLPLPPGVGVTQGRLTPPSRFLLHSEEDNNSNQFTECCDSQRSIGNNAWSRTKRLQWWSISNKVITASASLKGVSVLPKFHFKQAFQALPLTGAYTDCQRHRWGSANSCLWARFCSLAVSVSFIRTYSFVYCLWLLFSYNSMLMAYSAGNIYDHAPFRKSLLTLI